MHSVPTRTGRRRRGGARPRRCGARRPHSACSFMRARGNRCCGIFPTRSERHFIFRKRNLRTTSRQDERAAQIRQPVLRPCLRRQAHFPPLCATPSRSIAVANSRSALPYRPYQQLAFRPSVPRRAVVVVENGKRAELQREEEERGSSPFATTHAHHDRSCPLRQLADSARYFIYRPPPEPAVCRRPLLAVDHLVARSNHCRASVPSIHSRDLSTLHVRPPLKA
jgi:hypothetical protein